MKFIGFLLLVTLISYVASADECSHCPNGCDVATTSIPKCPAEDVGKTFRNNADSTSYYKCVAVNDPKNFHCDANKQYCDVQKACIPQIDWKYTRPCNF